MSFIAFVSLSIWPVYLFELFKIEVIEVEHDNVTRCGQYNYMVWSWSKGNISELMLSEIVSIFTDWFQIDFVDNDISLTVVH